MSTHAQGIRPLPKPPAMGRPKTVRDGVPTSVYLPARYVALIEEYRRRHGLRSTSEAHRKIVEEWAEREGVSPGGAR